MFLRFVHRFCNPTPSVAYDFLCWIKLASAPTVCPQGHPWHARMERGRLLFKCAHRLPGTVMERSAGELASLLARRTRGRKPQHRYVVRGDQCGERQPWHAGCPLGGTLPEMGPDDLVELIFAFAAQEPRYNQQIHSDNANVSTSTVP